MKLFAFLLALFSASMVFATIQPIPTNAVPSAFRSTAVARINSLIALPSSVDYDIDGTSALRVVRVSYDVSRDGGSQAAHALSATMPTNSMIIRSFFNIDTAFSGSGTIALSCSAAGDIFAATLLTGSSVGSLGEGVSTGSSATFKKTNGCAVTATVGGATVNAGKLTLWIEYVTRASAN